MPQGISQECEDLIRKMDLHGCMIDCFHSCLWKRQRKVAGDALKVFGNLSCEFMSEYQDKWFTKARRLYAWLLLPENATLWKKPRKTIPFERNTREYHNWRIACLNRDDWRCINCTKTVRLEVHHVKAYKDFKDSRLDIDNGRTLCKQCHIKEHKRLRCPTI